MVPGTAGASRRKNPEQEPTTCANLPLEPRSSGWIPFDLKRSGGFSAAELRDIERRVVERAPFLVEKWDEYFNIAD